MKHFFLALLICFNGSTLFSQNLEGLEFGTDTTLEVMTWNLEFFPTNGQTTLDYVSQIIEALEVDVIAVQEIDDYQKFLELLEGLNGWEGIATNTGYLNLGYIYNPEFVQMTSIYQIYPSKNRELPRKPLIMEIIFNGNEYVLINNHLKCCGDGIMNSNDPYDEETRRFDACVLIDEYIDENFPDDNVIVLGDLNDILTDSESNNVFQVFFDDPENYMFTDMAIAEGSSADWSYPSWPSHLDHLMISNELFDEFNDEAAVIKTIRIDDYLEDGFWEYEQNVSDHRPVAIKFNTQPGSAGFGDTKQNYEYFQVSPNPFSGKTTITFDSSDENLTIQIFDATGQLIKEEIPEKGRTSFDWSASGNLPGVYFIRLKSGNGIISTQKAVLLK